MSLYLAESVVPYGKTRATLTEAIDLIGAAAQEQGGGLIEVQVAADFTRHFVVIDAAEQDSAKCAFLSGRLPLTLIKPVRLVGLPGTPWFPKSHSTAPAYART